MPYWINEDRWYRSGLHLIRTYYVYLRTRISVSHDEDAIAAIEGMIGDFPEMLSPDGNYTPFSNGFVIRYITKQVTAAGLAEEWKDHLKYFEAWAIHDGMADAVESFPNGPISVALERLKAMDRNGKLSPLSQVFAVFHDADVDDVTKRRYDYDQAAEFIKGSWRHTTLPAFHFKNGRVLLVGTTESAVTMGRRLEARLPRRPCTHSKNRPRFEEIVICDGHLATAKHSSAVRPHGIIARSTRKQRDTGYTVDSEPKRLGRKMASEREFINAVTASLLKRATPRLNELLRERGVQHLSELPHEAMTKVRQQAILETVLTENPLADADGLRRTLQTLDNPQFIRAFQRVRKDAVPVDALEPTAGIDAAIFFAGLGLPVCPFDRRSLAPMGRTSAEIEEVAKAFANRKTAYVGYSPNLAPFYLLTTDCYRTLAEDGVRDPALAPVRDRIIEAIRYGDAVPARCFQWAVFALPRIEGEKVPYTIVEDPRSDRGSVVLYAG